MDSKLYKYVDGICTPKAFRDENVRSAIGYRPRDGDVFIVTYPKCGTTWTQYIVCNILTRGEPPSDIGNFDLMSPFLDARGAEGAKHPLRNGPLLTHLPPCVFQPVKGSKYIYVARNPNDCAVSFYHFLNGFQQRDFVDFDEFLTLFLSGKVPYGDYFDHLLFWYGRREDSNIHFVTYEQLKQDTREEVLKMADFLGAEHGTALRQDEALIRKVLEACRLDNMRTFIKENPVDRFQRATHVLCAASGDSNEALKNHEEVGGEIRNTSDFLRKGVVGDWKGYFTREQMEKTKAWIEEKTQGSDVMNLWRDFGLP